MKIELNRHSKVPLAEQICRALADRILSGQFEKGSQLPSVRRLTAMLNVSPVTVMHALDLLENENLITRIHGKGTFVYEDPPRRTETSAQPPDAPPNVPDYLHRSQDVYYNQLPADINFSLSAVASALLPTEVLAKSLRRIALEEPDILGKYGEIQGDLALRQAMAAYLKREKLSVSPHEILVTNGSQQGIDLVARCFLGRGDIVITEEPTYPAAIDVFRSRGATVLSVPVDGEGMRLDRLTELLDAHSPKLLYTVPTFHNPTGVVMSLKRRRALIDLAEAMNFLILEDDPWSEVHFDQQPPPHIKSMDTGGRVIFLKGLSKVLSPGIRIGFLIAATPILNRLIVAKTYADLGNPLLNQKVVLPIIRTKQMAHLFAGLRTTLKKRRDSAIRLLKKHAPPNVTWTVPQGGFNIWMTMPHDANANDLLADAEKHGVSFLPGSSCYPGDLQWHHLRISFSHVSEAKLHEGITKLCDLMRDYLARSDTRRGNTPLF